eukprot:4037776-Prymnesium_polylepis.2
MSSSGSSPKTSVNAHGSGSPGRFTNGLRTSGLLSSGSQEVIAVLVGAEYQTRGVRGDREWGLGVGGPGMFIVVGEVVTCEWLGEGLGDARAVGWLGLGSGDGGWVVGIGHHTTTHFHRASPWSSLQSPTCSIPCNANHGHHRVV